MSVQTMCRIIIRGGMTTVLLLVTTLFFNTNALAATVKLSTVFGGASVVAHAMAHPPVIGDCASCHPDVRQMPRIN